MSTLKAPGALYAPTAPMACCIRSLERLKGATCRCQPVGDISSLARCEGQTRRRRVATMASKPARLTKAKALGSGTAFTLSRSQIAGD